MFEEIPKKMYKNRTVSRKDAETPRSYMPRGPHMQYFWSPENINHYTRNLQIMKFALNPNLLSQARDRYKWITIDYDQERDNAYYNLNQEYLSMASPVVDEAKEEIRWDIAWQIFDEVNEGLDTDLEVDLNCLDIEEACAIAKQAIFDVA